MLGQDLINLFQDIGPLGLLLAFSLISFLDGFAIPTLPEAWLLLIAIADPGGIPKWSWGVICAYCLHAFLSAMTLVR